MMGLSQWLMKRLLNVDRFIQGDQTEGQLQNVDPPAASRSWIPEYFRAKKWKYYTYNLLAVFAHGVQCIAVFGLIGARTRHINPDFAFISPQRELLWQNYALLKSDTIETSCTDLRNSPAFQDRGSWVENDDMVDHNIFDFRKTVLLKYLKNGVVVHTDYMIAFFFLLSAAFQFLNGWILNQDADFPRVVHYIEYSVSSSLMLMAMAINVGIIELYTVTSLAGLFFAMNILGACTELMLYVLSSCELKGGVSGKVVYWLLLPLLASWVVFLFAIVPVLKQYDLVTSCSNTSVPKHVHFAIAVQSVLFGLFGLVHTVSVAYRVRVLGDKHKIAYAVDITDIFNISLSFVAKTILAWSLLAPALSVK